MDYRILKTCYYKNDHQGHRKSLFKISESQQRGFGNYGSPKIQKSKSISRIADELESTEEEIKYLHDIVLASAPGYNMENIINNLENEV